MMTREDKLWTMRMQDLKTLADKLGIKINIKAAKSIAVEKILEAEHIIEATNKKCEAEEQKKEDFKAAEQEVKDLWEKEANKEKTTRDQKQVENDRTAEEEFNKKHPATSVKPIKALENSKANKTTKEPKKANLKLSELTYKGETKSIRAWAEELNMPWATLYDRVNRNGWPVDLAIETPLGQRRPKKA